MPKLSLVRVHPARLLRNRLRRAGPRSTHSPKSPPPPAIRSPPPPPAQTSRHRRQMSKHMRHLRRRKRHHRIRAKRPLLRLLHRIRIPPRRQIHRHHRHLPTAATSSRSATANPTQRRLEPRPHHRIHNQLRSTRAAAPNRRQRRLICITSTSSTTTADASSQPPQHLRSLALHLVHHAPAAHTDRHAPPAPAPAPQQTHPHRYSFPAQHRTRFAAGNRRRQNRATAAPAFSINVRHRHPKLLRRPPVRLAPSPPPSESSSVPSTRSLQSRHKAGCPIFGAALSRLRWASRDSVDRLLSHQSRQPGETFVQARVESCKAHLSYRFIH